MASSSVGDSFAASDGLTEYDLAQPVFTNWSPYRVKIWGHTFPTAEHAYQYKKFETLDPKLANRIRRAACPEKAKQLGWSKPINRKEWDEIRVSVMQEILSAKCAQHEEVQRALKSTGNTAIIQHADDSDTFWGIGMRGNGKNTMGKLWMALRESKLSH